MSLWEYKIITSGKGGFASPALLEKFLNDLGREEWEIVQFHAHPDNFLVFTGLARRSTQRDWTLEDAAAAAAKAEAEKLRAEFEAKFKAATTSGGTVAEDSSARFLEEKVAPDDGFRKPVDTSRDADADEEDEKEEDDWDKLTAAEEDELPTFFDAIKPHMRRNQRGPGMSVGVDYLAKKWDQSEDDLKGALVECGFTIPNDEDAKPEYLEFEGDLYWINVNRRGELWINTKEKPRPVFRAVKAQKVVTEEEPRQEPQKGDEPVQKREDRSRKNEAGQKSEPAAADGGEATGTPGAEAEVADQVPGAPLPTGPELLEKIRPMMRRNRRGPGGSGSASFLSRALKVKEADLVAAFKATGLVVPASANEKPTNVEIGSSVWWVNVDSRGNVWINGRDKKPGETIEAPGTGSEAAAASGDTASLAGPEGAAAADSMAEPTAPTSESAPLSEQPSVAEGVPMTTEPSAVLAREASTEPQLRQPRGEAVSSEQAGEIRQSAPTGDIPVPQEAVPAAAAPDGVPAPELVPAASVEVGAPAGEPVPAKADPASPAVPMLDRAATLALVRPLLKENKTGAFAAKLDRLAESLAKPIDELTSLLVAAGMVAPEKAREKRVQIEHDGEIFWLNRNARGDLWLNAKARSGDGKTEDDEEDDDDADAESGEEPGDKKPRRSRARKKSE